MADQIEPKATTPLRVAVSGAGGLVGSSLVASLRAAGHTIGRLVRRPEDSAETIVWDPLRGEIDSERMEGFDAVVHLAGENIASGRWTERRKQRIRDSRVLGTRLIAEALAGLQRPPRVLINASAIGYYGDRGDEILDERARPGKGFLSETCVAWEEATAAAQQAGVRVVRLRIGVVLSRAGGVLSRLHLPFRLGLGGRVGSGRQYVSWIALDDLVAAVEHAMQQPGLQGPVNAVSPNPVTNAELTRALGRVLRRPTLFPLPAPVVRLAFGEMGRDLLLASTRAVPRRLEEARFRFLFDTVDAALRHELAPTAG